MRQCDTERSGGFLIDYEFYPRSLLNWQISWLFTFENPSCVIADDAKRFGEASSVAKETACNSKLTKLINGGHRMTNRERCELLNMATEKWIGGYQKSPSLHFFQFCKCGLKLIFGTSVEYSHL